MGVGVALEPAATFPVYLAPVEAQPGLLAVGEHLPQGHAEHPRVRGVGERPGLQTLWSAPEAPQGRESKANWLPTVMESVEKLVLFYPPCKGNLSVLLHDVMLVVVGQRPHQAKVPDLYFVG